MIQFSVFLNSRGRPQLLENAINSIYNNCSYANSIEMLVRVDRDDKETIHTLNQQEHPNLNYFVGDRPNNLQAELNQLAKQSVGDWLFVFNDDVQMLTQNWDIVALEAVAKYKLENGIKDNILLIKTKDDSADKCGPYSSFPIMGRQAFDTLGFFMYENFPGLGGDTTIDRVFSGINRTVDCDIQLNHILHATIHAVIHCDETARHMRENSARNFIDPFTFDVSPEIEKLKKEI